MTEKKEKEKEEAELLQGPGRGCRASHDQKGSLASRATRERFSSTPSWNGEGVGTKGFAGAEFCAFTLTVRGLGEAEDKSGDQFKLFRVSCVEVERK